MSHGQEVGEGVMSDAVHIVFEPKDLVSGEGYFVVMSHAG